MEGKALKSKVLRREWKTQQATEKSWVTMKDRVDNEHEE